MLPVPNASQNTMPVRAAIGAGVVAVTATDGHVYCYDAQTGALRWTGVTAYTANGKAIVGGDTRVVAISGQVVVAGSGQHGCAGYDPRQQGVLWNSNPRDTGGVWRLANAPGDRIFALHFAGAVSLLDAGTGNIRWVRTSTSNDRVNDFRIVNDTLFTTSIGAGLKAWKLPP